MQALTLTIPELASRWQMNTRQALAHAMQHGLPAYFYFDGLVFDFGDKWHRAGGDVGAVAELEAHRERQLTVDSDLQRQGLHKRGLLKLTQWEVPLGDEDMRLLRVEAERLDADIARLSALLQSRTDQRQRHVRNGLLRVAAKTMSELAQRGAVAFPQFAYMPHTPAAATSVDGEGEGGPVAAGKIVAIEDGFPRQAQLVEADICVAMQDVLDHEAAQARPAGGSGG